MPIVHVTRSKIQMESGGRIVTFHGEAYLPGYGSPDFVIYANQTRAWDAPFADVEIEKSKLAELLEQVKKEMAERKMTIEIE